MRPIIRGSTGMLDFNGPFSFKAIAKIVWWITNTWYESNFKRITPECLIPMTLILSMLIKCFKNERKEWTLSQNVWLMTDHSRVPAGMLYSNGPLLSCLFWKCFNIMFDLRKATRSGWGLIRVLKKVWS